MRLRRCSPWILLCLLVATASAHAQEPAGDPTPTYALDFTAQVVPSQRVARVTIRLGQGASAVEWIRFRIDPLRHRNFAGDGEIIPGESSVEWRPPKAGGDLSYEFAIDHLRDERSYDARCARHWAIFRGDDLVPAARVRTDPIARSRSRLYLQLPEGWAAALPYPRTPSGYYSIQHPERRFDRPTGWIAVGKLGVLRETVADSRVAIAGPAGHNLRRMDLLTFLRWTLPSMRDLFGGLPDRLVVVGAGDPMWRGGLSGPDSVFVHADRALVTHDGTSPILHELVHSLMDGVPGKGGDWISEGLAEYYSIETLRRSGSLSEKRYASVYEDIEERAARGGKLRVKSVSGDTTAKAVITLRDLGAEILQATEGARSLDDLLRLVARDDRRFTTARLREHAEELCECDLQRFFETRVPAPKSDAAASAP